MEKVKYSEEIREILYKIGFDLKFEDTDSFEEMGLDSIIFVKLILETEYRFDIEFPEDLFLFSNVKSVANLSKIIESLIEKKNSCILEKE